MCPLAATHTGISSRREFLQATAAWMWQSQWAAASQWFQLMPAGSPQFNLSILQQAGSEVSRRERRDRIRTNHRRERRTDSEILLYENKIGKNVHSSKRKWRNIIVVVVLIIINYKFWITQHQANLFLPLKYHGMWWYPSSAMPRKNKQHEVFMSHTSRGSCATESQHWVCVCLYTNIWSTITYTTNLAHMPFSLIHTFATGRSACLINHPACISFGNKYFHTCKCSIRKISDLIAQIKPGY